MVEIQYPAVGFRHIVNKYRLNHRHTNTAINAVFDASNPIAGDATPVTPKFELQAAEKCPELEFQLFSIVTSLLLFLAREVQIYLFRRQNQRAALR